MTSEQLRLAIIKEVLSGKLTRSKDAIDYKSIDDELFDMYQIPASWDIVSLDECCYIHARIGWQALRKEEHQVTGDYLLITGTDFKNGFVDYGSCVYVSKERYDMDEKIQLRNDDILITKDGSIGKVAVVKNLPKPATLNAGVFVIRPDDRFEKRYIEYLFQCSYFNHFVNLVKSGTTIKHLNQNKLLKFKIPVPTIDEQNEIVDVLDELLPYVDKFDSIDKELDKLNDAFPNNLKKSILNQAVMGKLVNQDPSDEPASVLLEKIRAEKDVLIKAGKLKKDKHESIIYRRDNSFFENIDGKETCIDDEITIDIPQSWEWCRLGDICSLSNGLASRGSSEGTERIVLRLADLSSGEINLSSARKIKLTDNEYMSHKVVLGNVIFIRVNGSKDRVANAFYYSDEREISFCDHLFRGIINSQMNTEYLVLIMSSEIMRHQITPEIKTTAGQNTISQSSMNNLLVPIPPIAEQNRIVEAIGELFLKVSAL